MSGQKKKTAGFPYLLLYSICDEQVLVKLYTKKPKFRKSIFIALPYSYGHFSLTIQENTEYFLKNSCHV